MRRAIIVGLTGQTGAGKTTVAEKLKKYGYSVIDADKIAALVTEKGSPVLPKLAEAFGADVLNSDGTLNRKLLAERAFASSDRTLLLNDITHPEIVRLILKKINGEFWNGYEAVLLDAPQLFESKLNEKCNLIISVTAPEEVRIARIMQRDGIDERTARQRISVQKTEQFFMDNSDVLIENDGNEENLDDKILYTARMIESRISGKAE